MTTSPYTPTLAFFGATGGCTVSCLALALAAGFQCNALVRTPAKLEALLKERNVPLGSANLTIIKGDVKTAAAVSNTLVHDGRTVDVIVSGIGGTPVFTPNPLKPTLDDPTICQDATATILGALRALPARADGARPLMVVVSTTGISERGRDIPLAMMPLYHWMLAVPHKDKKAMEGMLLAEAAKDPAARAIQGFVAVRPSLLTNGPRKGVDKIRVGTEEGPKGAGKPAVGYTISREDVGGWIFEEVVNAPAEKRGRWLDKMVSITY